MRGSESGIIYKDSPPKGDYKMNSNIEISYGLGDNKSLKRGTHYRAERERERDEGKEKYVLFS